MFLWTQKSLFGELTGCFVSKQTAGAARASAGLAALLGATLVLLTLYVILVTAAKMAGAPVVMLRRVIIQLP